MDQDFADYLKYLEESGFLKENALVLYSDHGQHSEITHTMYGAQWDRNNFMFNLIVPKTIVKTEEQYEVIRKN